VKKLLLALLLLAGCPKEPKNAGGQCGAEGRPPPATKDISTLLLADMPEACPRAQPRAGEPCVLPPVAATDSQGTAVEAWAECMYRRPEQGPCAYDSCTCMKTKEKELVWNCGSVTQ
jgi:hypothetical protein